MWGWFLKNMISIFQPFERSHITTKSKRSWLNVILIKIEGWFLIDNILLVSTNHMSVNTLQLNY